VATTFDCVIIGAGLAGSAAAAVMARDGVRVALVDPRASGLPAFKAEKIEPDQAELLRQLGLADGVLPHAARIHSIREAHRGRVLREVPVEQYGMPYHDMVDAVRAQIPGSVVQKLGSATGATLGPELQSITLDTGESLSTRLLVLAAGVGGKLHRELGVERLVIRAPHSVCSGFDVARVDGQPFPFESISYWADSLEGALDYVTLFVMPGRMRVNVFSYLDPKDPWFRQLAGDPRAALEGLIPGLTALIGDWAVTSKVESHAIDLYRAATPETDGVVLIGDAWQSVCPATGTGLTKVLTDVDVLCRTWLPQWLAAPGMEAGRIAPYYSDARKVAVDRESLASAEYRRRFSVDGSWRWRLHRRRAYLQMGWSGFRASTDPRPRARTCG
jgi:2-polyprenyl-6-methoxyphenol hydroxylase-like FAD-dependent oxidoreductase